MLEPSRAIRGVLILLLAAPSSAAAILPNVVFVFSDQHRMADYPGEPHTRVVAPSLERLARQGVVFANAISNYPVCSPFRAMLMTGKAPFKTGVVENRILLREEGDSFGNVFRRAGYRTAYIGKWHLGAEDAPRQGYHGFDHFQPWIGSNRHVDSSYWEPATGRYVKTETYNATGMIDQALAFIEEHRRAREEAPFLVMVSLNPPHSNYFDAPDAFRELYADGPLPLRPNVAQTIDPRFGDWTRRARVDEIRRGYLSHISAIDHEIGRLLDYLDEHSLGETTIVVYSSDHGEMLGSHGRMGKRQPFEESIRIPFVVRWRGKLAEPERRRDTLIGAIDFLPTVAGLAGVAIPDGLDGRDHSGVLRGEAIEEPAYQPIMHIFRDLAGGPNHPAEIFRGVRTKRFTYAATIAEHFVLYDLEKDPYQQHNLIDDPAFAEHRQRLAASTQAWLDAWQDPFRMPAAVRARQRRDGN